MYLDAVIEEFLLDVVVYTVDHNAMKKLVKSGEILIEVERVVGKLG